MGQDISMYTENFPNLAVLPNLQQVLPQLQRLKPRLRLSKDSFDLERELRKWLSLAKEGDHTDSDEGEAENEGENCHLRVYEHYRTQIGSPSINRRFFTQDEMNKFINENDGFPLPSTDEEIKAFDQQVFIDQSQGWGKTGPPKRSKKRDRQRSKSATAVPDLATIRLKLQKLHSPGKPKFIEHLINRVVSKRVSRRASNGLINTGDDTANAQVEPLSPDSEKCLQQAEAIVEELLSCTARPVSGESTDSGKGSLLESTSDFSPTSKRKSFSTPASPSFHGIVKERLRSFQVLNESSDTESVCSQVDLHSPLHKQKSFKNEEFDHELKEINKSIKQFYCSISQDESFNSAVMESGYVKALVAKINDNKLKPDADQAKKNSEDENPENSEEFSDSLKLKLGNGDLGWDEYDQELGENVESGEENNEAEENTEKPCRRESGSVNSFDETSDVKTRTASLRSSHSSVGSSSSRENSQIISVSDSDSQVSRALKRFNQERSKSIPKSCLSSISTSPFSFHNSHIRSPPKLRSLNSNKLGDSKIRNTNEYRNTNGAVLSSCAKNRNCLSCDVESTVEQSAGQTGSTEKRGCVSQSFDYGLLPLNPAELFDENWSKSELSFDDFDCDLDSLSDVKKKEEEEKPKDKLHQIAHELLTTERAYVARLHLLDQVFHFRVTMENKNGNFLPQEAITQMFANIKPIFVFHNDFLLPQLEARMQNWSAEQKIGDVMAKLAPFLKIYTEYVKNYDKAMAMIDKWMSQSPKFAALIQEIQKSPECGLLTLQHHMLEPIQRVPRYELLLKDYLKRLEPDSIDRPDAQKALDLVTEAASHSNTAMKKLDKFHKLLNIIPQLNGEGTNDLVSPTRELVKEGPITKISARSGEKQARYIFLFNDLLLVCSDKMMGSYKLRARLSVEGMEITAGDNQMIQNTFCVKCVEKTVEFLDEANNGQGLDWFATFQQVAADCHHKSKLCRVRSSEPGDQSGTVADGHPDMGSQLGLKSPQWVKDEEVTMCMACQDRFTALKRRHHCRACGKVFCAKCSSKKAQLQYDNNQVNRVCQRCHDLLKRGRVDSLELSNEMAPPSPKPAAQIHKADEVSVLSGYLSVMDKDHKWTKRWIAVHEDFAMYFYKKHKDVAAIQTLPLPGHNVKVIGDSVDRPNVFSLTHKDVSVCYFQADSDLQFQQWLRVLEKLIKLELPSDEEKRMSTHSDSSSQSNSSGSSGLSSQS